MLPLNALLPTTLPSLAEAAAVGMAAYTGLFFLVATWVGLDAVQRGIRAWPYVAATLVMGWGGLGAYLAARHLKTHPRDDARVRACIRAAAEQVEEVVLPVGGSHSPATP